MPIRPIDLQVLFMQQNEVAREQSVEKDGAKLAQEMQGAAAQKKLVEAKDEVTKAEQSKEGPAPIKEGSGGGAGLPSGQRKKGEADKEESAEEAAEEVVRDPGLGTRVDLSG